MPAGAASGSRFVVGSMVLGRYRLDRQVGSGGMGVLWQATDTVLDGVVALKRVSFAHLGDEQAMITRHRTMREARVAARLRGHPHVVSLYDVQVDEGDVWLVMEYLPSQSLAQSLAGGRTLTPPEVARIGAEVADALVAAHALGIRHRDITPGNVLLGADGTVKLTDFGVAHSTTDVQVTETGAVVGTVAYLAPEVAAGDDATVASDVFTLGATLYAACEGQPPFGQDPNAVRMLHIISAGRYRAPQQAGPLEPLLLRMLARDPATRPDAATVRDQLAQLSGTPVTAPPERPPHRWWRAGLAAGIVVLVLAAIGGIVALTGHGDDTGRGQAAPTTTQAGQLTPDSPQDGPGVPTLPGAVPHIAMPGSLRTVDTCQLVDTPALRRYGQLKILRGTAMFGCGVLITAPDGAMAVLADEFSGPDGNGSHDGTETDLGGLRIFQEPRVTDSSGTSCHGVITLSDNSAFFATAYPTNGPGRTFDLCGLVQTLNYATAGQLARTGTPPQSNFADAYPLAAHDACSLVDDRVLITVRNLDVGDTYAGPANWSCHWGADRNDPTKPSVTMTFQLAAPADFSTPDHHDPIQIGPIPAFQQKEPDERDNHSCTVYLPQQKTPNPDTTTQVVKIQVSSPEPRPRRCQYAQDIAAAANKSLTG